MDRRSFLARFREFEPAPRAMVEESIEEATRNVDSSVWRDKTQDGIRWKTAHLLAISPFGQQARLVSNDGSTTYGKHFEALARSVTPGFRVA